MQWLVLAFYLWFCCTYFWTIDPLATLEKMRSYFQEMMIVWLVWEFAESPRDLRSLLRAFIAGSYVLAALTVANLGSPEAVAAGQIRFAATGQDPNDVARFLDLGFPLAALLFISERRWSARLLALGYLPLGLFAVLLTASRGGFLAAIVALVGCGILLARTHLKGVVAGILSLPMLATALWFCVPHETIERLATIPEQFQSGNLNQRLNIWTAGWHALCPCSAFWQRSWFFRRRSRNESPRHGSQYRSFHPCRRRPVRLLSRRGHRSTGYPVDPRNPWDTAPGSGSCTNRLDRHFAGGHGGREPHHLAAIGPDRASRASRRRRPGASRR